MEEIKTNRIRGYLDLDSYFRKHMDTFFYDLEDLHNKGLIEYEQSGISEKFWILSPHDGSRIVLYKDEELKSYGSYIELLVEEMAKIMEIPCAHYDLATFDGWKGVISYNFLKEDNNYSGFDVISMFYESKLAENPELCELYNIDYEKDSIDDVSFKLNNLQDIWCILEDRYKEHPDKQMIVETIMNGLVDKLILDVVAVGVDSHVDNWIITSDNELSPAFDNSRALGITTKFKGLMDNNTMLQDDKLLLTVDNENIDKPLEVLEYFLKISSSEYNDRVIDKISKLEGNINSIPTKIEERTEHCMPQLLKTYFISCMTEHLDKINEIISKNKVAKK